MAWRRTRRVRKRVFEFPRHFVHPKVAENRHEGEQRCRRVRRGDKEGEDAEVLDGSVVFVGCITGTPGSTVIDAHLGGDDEGKEQREAVQHHGEELRVRKGEWGVLDLLGLLIAEHPVRERVVDLRR